MIGKAKTTTDCVLTKVVLGCRDCLEARAGSIIREEPFLHGAADTIADDSTGGAGTTHVQVQAGVAIDGIDPAGTIDRGFELQNIGGERGRDQGVQL